MKRPVIALCAMLLAGCSTPNPNPKATAAVYEQIQSGMTRRQVYDLLGPPRSVNPPGDFWRCQSAMRSIPHDSHGSGHWTVYFGGDTVASVDHIAATVTISGGSGRQ